MKAVIGLIFIFWIGKLLFGKSGGEASRKEREKQTFLEYPEGGYGLDKDPVMDELFFLDIMEDEHSY